MHALSLVAASLSLASALQIEPTPAVKPLLKLRGGLGGIDAGQVATIVQGISAANAGVMSLAPKKAGEMYGVALTKWTEFFAQWSGIIMFGQVLTAYLHAGGMALPEALAWGFLPSCVASVQDFLNDRMVGEMGMGEAAKYAPPLVNFALTLGAFGKVPNLAPELAAKAAAVWMAANGLFGYFSTAAWLEGWGGKGLSAVESGMGKLMASTMCGGAVYIAASAFRGKTALECFGAMMGMYALTSLDGLYLSKTTEAMGVDPPKVLFWAAIQAFTAAAVFL